MSPSITPQQIERSLSYASYRDMIGSLLIERKTTGNDQSKQRVEFTRLNAKRMDRLVKQTRLNPELIDLLASKSEPQIWVGLVEAWCGDVPHAIAPAAVLAASVPGLSLRLLLRDEHPELMDAYLTDGARAIPVIIALKKENLEEMWNWGPRPAELQQLIKELKSRGESPEAMAEAAQRWYLKDKGQTFQSELLEKVRYALKDA